MTDDKLIALVSETRKAQRDYFKCRTASLLKICKALEKRVDDELCRREAEAAVERPSLMDLFGRR